MKNVALGRKTLDYMEAHPENVQMDVWGMETACGTVACTAGHALLQDGYLFQLCLFYRTEPDDQGRMVVISEAMEARERLGLTDDEYCGASDGYAQSLFDGQQDAVDAIVRFRRIVERSEAALEESRHA